jgi:MATE family multidrug resistance protein
MVPLSVLVALFPESLASIYTNDPAVIPIIVTGLFVAVFLILADGLQGVLLGALRGAADVWPTTGLGFTAFWIIMVPLAWLLGHHWGGGVPGLLWAEVIGIFAATILFGWRFRVIARREIKPFS